MERVDHATSTGIIVPRRTLMVLCGPAAAGKSTFASERFAPSVTVASDHCRELICDDSNNQHVNRDTFELFYYIINKRMYLSRFTVADSTALQAEPRRRLLELARRHSYLTCLLLFNVPLPTCLERNRQRGRVVEEQVIAYQVGLLHQALRDAPREGWQQIHTLDERKSHVNVEVLI